MKTIDRKDNLNGKTKRKNLRTVLICALAIVLIAAANLMIMLLPTASSFVDVSGEKIHSISEDTEQVIKALSKPTDLYLVAQRGNEDLNAEITLDLYADCSDRVSSGKLDPSFDLREIEELTGETVLEDNTIIVTSRGNTRIIEYGDYYSGGEYILEDHLNHAISYVTSDTDRFVMFTEGHNETAVANEILYYIEMGGFKTGTIDLSDTQIPEECVLVVMNCPKEDIGETELKKLISYFNKGGSILIDTDYSTEASANFEKMLTYFGIEIGCGQIVETEESRIIDDNPACFLPMIHADTLEALTKGIEYVVISEANPIVINNDSIADIKVILDASDTAFVTYDSDLTDITETVSGPFPVEIFSTVKESGAGLVLFSSMDISDSSLNEYGYEGNAAAFLNAAELLGYDNEIAIIHGKSTSTNYLSVDTKEMKIWRIVLIVALPAAIVIVGLLVVVGRRRR